MRVLRGISILLLMVLIIVPFNNVFGSEEKLLPSAVKQLVNQEFRAYRASLPKDVSMTTEEWYAKREEITLKHLASVDSADLTRKEMNIYGDLLQWAKKNTEAKKVFSQVANGTDLLARNAAKIILSIDIEDMSVPIDSLRADLNEYRQRFAPAAEDSFGLYSQVSALAARADKDGKPANALEIIKNEIDYLNMDQPYWAWRIVSRSIRYYKAAEKADDGLKLLKMYEENFTNTAEKRKVNRPEDEDAAKAYDKATTGFEKLAQSMASAYIRETIVGNPAPGFTFTHFFNTDAIDYDKLRGKVVVVDFWATWCGPCIGTFPEMRKFYAEYKDKGVQVIGVTGFQGSMQNHGEDRLTGLSQEEELALMPTFIKHQSVTWPLAFSERNCYDPEYGIEGIPTLVVIDKKGNVRLMTHPANKEEIIAKVEELLVEE